MWHYQSEADAQSCDIGDPKQTLIYLSLAIRGRESRTWFQQQRACKLHKRFLYYRGDVFSTEAIFVLQKRSNSLVNYDS